MTDVNMVDLSKKYYAVHVDAGNNLQGIHYIPFSDADIERMKREFDETNEPGEWMYSGACLRAFMSRYLKEKFDYDMLVFFSPTGVRALLKNFPDFKQGDIKIAAFGPATAREIAAQGLRLDLEAPTKDCPSMAMALRSYLKENEEK